MPLISTSIQKMIVVLGEPSRSASFRSKSQFSDWKFAIHALILEFCQLFVDVGPFSLHPYASCSIFLQRSFRPPISVCCSLVASFQCSQFSMHIDQLLMERCHSLMLILALVICPIAWFMRRTSATICSIEELLP